MALSFKEHLEKRTEAFDFLKKMLGKGGDTGDKTSVDAQLAKKAGKSGADVASAAGGLVGNTMKVATNIATGNVIGTAVSVWNWLDGVIKGGSALRTLSKVGTQVKKVQDHKIKLTKYLEEKRIQPASAKKIIEAIFEIDPNDVEHVSQPLWAASIIAFLEGLDSGYDNIQQKVFTSILHQKLMEQVQKTGANAEKLSSDIQELMSHLQGETQKNSVILSTPQIKTTIARFNPEEYESEGNSPVEPEKPRPTYSYSQEKPDPNNDDDYGIFGKPPGEEEKKKKSWWGKRTKAPTTVQEWEAIPKKNGLYQKGDVVYKKENGRIIPGVIIANSDSWNLYAFFLDSYSSSAENPERIRGVGEKITDMKGTALYTKLVDHIESGHQHGLESFAQEVGIPIKMKKPPAWDNLFDQ